MDDWSAWQTFFTTGSVLDYIRYKSIQDAKDSGALTVIRVDSDEIPNRGTEFTVTEYL